MALVVCKHCGRLRRPQGRGLCGSCWKRPDVRAAYPLQVRRWRDIEVLPESEAELEARVAEQLARDDAWTPFPGPADDPEYNRVVARREARGLLPRHPQDHGGVPPGAD